MSDAHLQVPHQLTANVKLLHKVAIRVGDEVLILKRSAKAKSRPGKWDLPGGNSEWPHDLADNMLNPHQRDVAREIEEETSLIVPADTFTKENLVYFATYYEAEKKIFSVNLGWQVTELTAEAKENVKISFEHQDSAWITLEQLSDYDFGGPERDYETKIIRQVLSK